MRSPVRGIVPSEPVLFRSSMARSTIPVVMQDNLILRRAMAFERADGRRGVGLGNVAHTGLPSNRGHNLLPVMWAMKMFVTGWGISETPDPETPVSFAYRLTRRTAT